MSSENSAQENKADEFKAESIPEEIINDFLAESNEQLQGLEIDFITLEKEPDNTDLLNNIFRAIHSMKGVASFIGYKNLEGVSDKAEDVLNKLRKQELSLTSDIMDALLSATDIIKLILKDIEDTKKDTAVNTEEIINRLLEIIPDKKEPSVSVQETELSKQESEGVKQSNDAGPSTDLVSDEMEDIINDFLTESNEQLQGLEIDFITLEKEPDNSDLLNNIFRVIHSMKGAASFIGYKNLEGVSHKAEDVLNKLRKQELSLTSDIMDTLLSATDIIKLILKDIEDTKKDTAVNTEEIINRLENIIRKPESQSVRTQNSNKNTANIIQEKAADQQSSDKAIPTNAPSESRSKAETATPASSAKSSEVNNPPSQTQSTGEEIRSIRINVEKLDYLFNLIGELVLTRNRNVQLHRLLSRRYPDDDTINLDLTEAGEYLNQLTSELQWAVMNTRMMPVSTVFNKFRRIVRDIAKSLGKEIELHMTGEETEFDKNIIEGIGDPLTHLIRNSADHGIEMPDERESAGKQRTGRIDMKAYYEGNYVIISIKDDGKGIDINVLKRKAVEKGIIDEAGADKLTKPSLLNLIFAPGFSTVQTVSTVSGRGVGMDVVKTNIEKLRGQIIIDSDTGTGTEIIMKIPLTLAIIDSLVVNVSDQRYAVPLSNVVETHRIKYSRIEMVRGSMVFRMRDELMPLVMLSDLFNLTVGYDNESEVTVVVLKNGLLRMGLIVDKTAGQEEVVIKPLDCLDGITELDGVSGATILGDGSITFILDVDVLMKLSKAAERHLDTESSEDKDIMQIEVNTTNVVLVDNLGKEQYAIPARNIKEIELIHKTDIEDIGGRLMIRYRGSITPLTTISSITNVPAQREFDNYYMVILTDKGNDVGLLVGRLLGVKKLEESSINNDNKTLNGVIGSAIFNGKITLMLNIEDVITSSLSLTSSDLICDSRNVANLTNKTKKILIVDDIKMHRTIIENIVKEAGHEGISAEDGLDALDKLNDKISLILTDLEMPNMNGYEFTKEAKKRHPDIPVVMVTSMSGEEDRAKGLEAGVDKYLVKWDEETVLKEIKKYMQL